jgi:hypothetical protein
LPKKSGLISQLIRAGFMGRAGLIFLARRADFLNFTVTFFRESVTIFLAECDYFIEPVLLFSRPVVTALQTVCFYYDSFLQMIINQSVIVKYQVAE